MRSAQLSPRRVAVRILRDVEQRSGFSNRILSDHLERHPELDRRDRGLITTLVYGVLRQRARLDALIDACADKPSKLKGELRTILRVAVFELIELQRPLAIANAEASKLSKRIDSHGRLSKMITAILHRIDREREQLEQRWQAEPLDALRFRWSLPEFLARRWLAALGPAQALARAQALLDVPTVDLRVDLHRSDAVTVRTALLDEQPGLNFVELPATAGEQPQCLRARGGGDLFYGPTFEAGLVSIQSLGSQQAVRVLDPRPGERVLDACAGMGTKTVQIAEHMQRRGTIVAVDASAERLAALDESRGRCGLDDAGLDLRIVEARLGQARLGQARLGEGELDVGSGFELGFDAVLLDAPCTGLGNLARHPELRWASAEASGRRNQASAEASGRRNQASAEASGRRNQASAEASGRRNQASAEASGRRNQASAEANIEQCARVQAELLAQVAALVRAGGRLVYAVCSLEPEEGLAIVNGFLATQLGHGFELVHTQAWTPEVHQTDGFWLARLDRR